MDKLLKPLTALGHDAPVVEALGRWKLVEVFDVALASVAPRRGREAEVAKLAATAGIPLPEVARFAAGPVFGAFWLTPDMWMVEAPLAGHEDIRAALLAVFGGTASVTEQTDAWVRFDIDGPDLPRLFVKLCNVDLAGAADGFATRTVVEHIGCYLVKRGQVVTLYAARSMAESLHHALHLAAGTVA